MPISRRFHAQRVERLLPLIALAALACSTGASGSESRSAAAPTLVIDNSFALYTLDPQREFDHTSTIVDRAVYDTLFTYRDNDLSHPVPLLAASYRASSNAKTFTVQLKRDVHFADGTPLTAADVVFSLRRLINLKANPSFLLFGAEVSAKGKYTVVIDMPTPTVQLPVILANPATGIVNSRLVQSHGGTDAADAATSDNAEPWFNSSASAGAGSGPYEIDSYTPGSQVVLRPNTNYWGSGRPGFDRVVIRNMTAPIQLLNIRRGSHQIAIDLSADQAQTLKGEGRLHVSLQPSPWTFYLFTHDDPQISSITSNTRFQQAVRHALDYEAIRAVAGQGAVQAPGIIPSVILGALQQNKALKTSVAEARADLSASGVGTQEVTLEYPSDVTINGVSFATLAQKVQASLQAAGFKIRLSGSPLTTFQPKFRADKVAFGLWIWGPDYPDPADYLVFTPGQLIALHVGWPAGSDPAIEMLAAKARAATTLTTRRSLYQQIQLALNARSPFIPLIQPTQAFVATTDLAGAVFSGAYDVDLTQISPT